LELFNRASEAIEQARFALRTNLPQNVIALTTIGFMDMSKGFLR